MVGLNIVDSNSYSWGKEFKDALLLTLMTNFKYTLLPEIYKAFGKNGLLKFIDVFGGATITVPSHSDLTKAIRDVQIYLDAKNRRNGKPTFAEISDRYGVSRRNALKICQTMRTKFAETGMHVDQVDDLFKPEDIEEDK